ncbi:MAG: TldD/PmbA family protein [Gemmatimonadales bacterium]
MIERLLGAVAGRVPAADAVTKSDDTVTVELDDERRTAVASSRSVTSHLRVCAEGAVAVAGGTDRDPEELVARVLAALPHAERLTIHLPAPSPLPVVMTRSPQGAVAGPDQLLALLRPLADRLSRTHRRVHLWAERSAGSVRIANSRGVLAEYEVTLVGLGATVHSIGAGAGPPCHVHIAAVTMPAFPEIESLVSEVERRLDPVSIETPPLPPRLPVWFTPRATAGLLRPLRAALLGREALLGGGPFRERRGERAFDERLSLVDDPLVPARPGSRPIDDEGVPSRRVTLVENGRIVGVAVDLRVGSLAGVPSTGHGWRRAGAPPQPGFTNLIVRAGDAGREVLFAPLSPGLLVEDLEWGAGANALPGSFAVRAPWAYLVAEGEVRGRLEGIVLSGNVFALLTRLIAIGSDATWLGGFCSPSLVLDGVSVIRR